LSGCVRAGSMLEAKGFERRGIRMEDEKREAEAPAPDETVAEAKVPDAGTRGEETALVEPDVAGEPDTASGPAGETVVEEPVAPVPTPAPARPRVNTKGRGGTAGIFAGVAIIAPVLIRELTVDSQPFLLLPLAIIVLGVAISGFRVGQGGRDGKLGRLGFILAELGVLVLTVMLLVIAYKGVAQNTRLQSGEWLLNVGMFALIGGILIFGAASLVAGVLSRGAMLMMMVSLPLGVFLDSIGAFPGRRFTWGTPTAFVFGQGMHYGLKIFGLSLIWLGYSILKDTKAKARPVASEV
jgi:hypothetical protein